MPTVERLAKRRTSLQPVSHDGALLADARGAAQRRNHHVNNMADHETATAFPARPANARKAWRRWQRCCG